MLMNSVDNMKLYGVVYNIDDKACRRDDYVSGSRPEWEAAGRHLACQRLTKRLRRQVVDELPLRPKGDNNVELLRKVWIWQGYAMRSV